MSARRLSTILVVLVAVSASALASCSTVQRFAHGAPEQWAFDRIEDLPQPSGLRAMTLADALAERRSARDFAATPLDVEGVADLLWAAQGVTASWGGRTAPSAGALYPLEVYLVTDAQASRYVPEGHRVQVREAPSMKAALADAVGQAPAADAPAVFVITGTPARLEPKYLGRAERFTLLEAGHAAQNLLLAATALGLGGVPIGSFDADAVATVLGLPSGEDPIYVIPVGVPESAP
jgi:SagB-type dehydrogenase family enzyme